MRQIEQEQQGEIRRLREEQEQLKQRQKGNKEKAGEDKPRNQVAKRRSIGNGEGIDDKLASAQQKTKTRPTRAPAPAFMPRRSTRVA